jgi:hypothetical protein
LIFCLSRFEERKAFEGASGLGRPAFEGAGREARANFARAVVRFFMGAYIYVSRTLLYRKDDIP